MRPERLFQLMHLADSALPVGGFAFSNGLECAVQSGAVHDGHSLYEFLCGVLDQLCSFDVPFINAIYAAQDPWTHVRRFDAMTLAPAVRRASVAQGRGWMRTIATMYPDLALDELAASRKQAGVPPHFLPLFTLTLKEAGFSQAEVRLLYGFIQVRDQMGAAIRLGVVGPTRAQALQAQLESTAAERVSANAAADAEVWRSAPLLELFQAGHDELYSKLFQS